MASTSTTVNVAGFGSSGSTLMRFGVWYHLRNPPQWPRQDPADLDASTLDQIGYCRDPRVRLGVDLRASLHQRRLPSVVAPVPRRGCQLGRRASGWARPACCCPCIYPLRVAEDAAVLDILSGGLLGSRRGCRLQGRGIHDFFQVPHKDRGKRMDEALGDSERFHGATIASRVNGLDLSVFVDVTVTPKPLQRPLPLYMGGQSKPAIRRAAPLGVSPAAVVHHRIRSRALFTTTRCASSGHDPDAVPD